MIIHILPASDAYAREHFDGTVAQKISTNRIKDFITDNETLKLLSDDEYGIWGIKKGKSNINHNKWLKMSRGDICLFYRDKHLFSVANVVCKFENYDFSLDLWKGIPRNPDIDDTETWEDMFLIDKIKKIDIPVVMFNRFMNYKEGHVFQGYRNYNEEISEKIIEEFELYDWETYSRYNPSISESDNRRAIQEILESIGGTDAQSSGGRSRREQSLHREYHFANKQIVQCALCHKYLPTNLLHAAHIKPRRNCTEEERKDLNVTMPVCKLGCDDLFEKGYLIVNQDGVIDTNRSLTPNNSTDINEFIEQYSGKYCLYHNDKTSDYFKSRNSNFNV
tara:strand:- start:112 stop:1116 length:1005 start_codon:yes stop_codon:yes gene_type:complete